MTEVGLGGCVGSCLRRNDGGGAGVLGAGRGEIPAASAGMTEVGAGRLREGGGVVLRGVMGRFCAGDGGGK